MILLQSNYWDINCRSLLLLLAISYSHW